MIWMLNHLSLSFFSEREELSQRRTSIAVLCGCGPNAQIVQHSAENPTSARCLNSAHSMHLSSPDDQIPNMSER